MSKAKRRRLDDELVEQGFFLDRDTAMRAVLAGMVSSCGERLTAPGRQVAAGCALHVRGSRRSSARGRGVYVSRGGLKLEGALEAFSLDPTGMNCLDIGCSTGGFTDCLLKFGARRVAAVDVGYGQFDWGLRGDARVALFERTNICEVSAEQLGGPFDLVVADVSFTSVGRILDAVRRLAREGTTLCTLVKPQFEAARDEVGEGGIVRDRMVHLRVLRDVCSLLADGGLAPWGACGSPIHGAKGNIEYFVAATCGGGPRQLDLPTVVGQAWDGVASCASRDIPPAEVVSCPLHGGDRDSATLSAGHVCEGVSRGARDACSQ